MTSVPKMDMINHPNHYTAGIECWDYIVSHNMGYLDGNVIKYVTRYRHKDGLKDLFKAEAYIKRLIKQVQDEIPLVEQPLCNCADYPCQDEKLPTIHISAYEVERTNGAIPLPPSSCQLDGRNCAPSCACQADAYIETGSDAMNSSCCCGHPERGICDSWKEEDCCVPLDMGGRPWITEEELVDEIVFLMTPPEHHPEPVRPAFESDPYLLGDFRRGGPGATWQHNKVSRYDPS